ncbi:hypothetical protein PENTCL1PPCAC_6554, partial [Pristionchus entomophagus]
LRIMLYLLLALPLLISAKPEFDNALTNAPKVSCDRASMSLDISSSRGAPSVVFAKGHFNKEGCSFRNATHLTLDFEKCNVKRKRELNPRRMVYSTIVVVQLHPLFITKVDRAYAVSCNYMEVEKNVGAGITVSELTTQLLSTEREQPTCTYSLKKDSPNGPNVKLASVGDSIYHVWECPSEIYAMFVHSCVVQDGQGQEQRVMDENGCSIDKFLMPELVYSTDLTKTFTAAEAFNFPDVTSVQFSCQIKCCLKGDDSCSSITPPKCGNPTNLEPAQVHNAQRQGGEDLDEQLLSTLPSITRDPIFGQLIDGKTTESETAGTTIPTSSSTQSTTTTRSTATVISTIINNGKRAKFPVPPEIREYIKEKNNTIEGSGFEDELNEREQRRDIKRRDTDTLDMDITSPELTIIERELVDGERVTSPLSMSSLAAPTTESVCVPITAFWLLIGLVLLSLSFILAAIYKASSKSGFVQF